MPVGTTQAAGQHRKWLWAGRWPASLHRAGQAGHRQLPATARRRLLHRWYRRPQRYCHGAASQTARQPVYEPGRAACGCPAAVASGAQYRSRRQPPPVLPGRPASPPLARRDAKEPAQGGKGRLCAPAGAEGAAVAAAVDSPAPAAVRIARLERHEGPASVASADAAPPAPPRVPCRQEAVR